MNPTILTHSAYGYGKYFNFNRPDLYDYNIEEIAHALSLICRFTGHVKHHYSVAQHSVLVSHLVPREYEYAGLMHDAHEAYVGDVPTPLKRMLPNYKLIERDVEQQVQEAFCVLRSGHCKQEVKAADLLALAIEKRDLMPLDPDPQQWQVLDGINAPDNIKIAELTPRQAEQLFLDRYEELTT